MSDQNEWRDMYVDIRENLDRPFVWYAYFPVVRIDHVPELRIASIPERIRWIQQYDLDHGNAISARISAGIENGDFRFARADVLRLCDLRMNSSDEQQHFERKVLFIPRQPNAYRHAAYVRYRYRQRPSDDHEFADTLLELDSQFGN